MSEEKILQHASKAVHAVSNKESGWKKRVKEFSLEILIIIVGVSITLAFHNWNERVHEKKIAKEFLTGVRGDLQQTYDGLKKSVIGYETTVGYFDTVWNQILTNKVNSEYVDTASHNLIHSSFFQYNNARFESFKASGYLKLIENADLQNKITGLYSAELPWMKYADETVYAEKRADYTKFIGSKMLVDAKGNHLSALLNDPGVRYYIQWYGMLLRERINQKKDLLEQLSTTIKALDKELND
jgi:hypothetical protein